MGKSWKIKGRRFLATRFRPFDRKRSTFNPVRFLRRQGQTKPVEPGFHVYLKSFGIDFLLATPTAEDFPVNCSHTAAG